MLKDITLGQYFPGDSVVHKMDPRTKLIMVVLYIVALFLADGFAGYAVMILVTAGFVWLSKVPPKSLFKGLKPVLIIIVLTAVLNVFYTDGTVLVQVWKLKITYEGIIRAVFMVLRIVMLICGTFLLTYTTAPVALTDGMELLLHPLNKLKVPVHEMSMMMSMALRFIPTLIEETDKIMSAQKARGADFETGSLIDRAKALLPILVPLFISAFRRADELAIAMESRCYNGGAGRTRMKQLRYERRDYLALVFGVLLIAGMIGLQVVGV
ncbi:MAG: energy-coupling factor transporter transmembrane protein EcfT [Oscillospiraceae bacterium]|nr:energy-coupling factor transporter transmembrane protein EcfT [Oscillospiraceae bacterium]